MTELIPSVRKPTIIQALYRRRAIQQKHWITGLIELCDEKSQIAVRMRLGKTHFVRIEITISDVLLKQRQ
ncbi:hypothetical protein WM11_06860 [Burkholderia ubonensis]|nr:hypothetical protein WM10_19460 [Burkholderia ubonensis]CFL32292.1 Uncharacterised protein [Burkholderia pseudomallei]KWK09290.1 hypothetical protein WM11_06860 [Burkholderia ubonensis]KWK10602.1 hypothetical protein WM12_00950 [Burkholderia ubonensis]KWK38146.1 hypothetical protein WM13_22325 [Burkholderia ubonensis]